MQPKPTLRELRDMLRPELPLLSQRYKVESLGLFGSYVRNQQKPESDLDVLVSIREAPTLLKFIELENHLSDLLRVKVDLVMKEALKPRLSKKILSEVQPV